jgi:hypothetical protein
VADPQLDNDVILATADLVGRTGATGFELGYLHENVPVEEADWYAHAQLAGARITVEHQPSPTAAAQALAERILKGGKCKCGKLTTTSTDGAFAFLDAHTTDGKRWGAKEAAQAGQCLWRRVGKRWIPGCEADRG